MKVIGVTGSIGSGKSTVAEYIKDKGFDVFDADQVSREMTATGGKALKKIRESFGDQVFFKDGSLNRKRLAEIVFKDEEKKKELEDIVTKKVIQKMKEWTNRKKKERASEKKRKTKAIFLDVPLLFESGLEKYCDEVWTVACDDDIRLKRIVERGGISLKDAKRRIASQMPQEEKIALSDVVIYNNGSVRSLKIKLSKLIKEYLD